MAKFKPGQSGNPGGRPKGLRALLVEKYGADAETLVDALHGIAFSKKKGLEAVAVRTKIDAIKLLLAYHSGQPPQSVEMTDGDGVPVGPITFVIKGRKAK